MATELLSSMEPGSRIELPTFSLPRKRSTTELPGLLIVLIPSLWWGEEDSNLRRLSRQIYSLFPLAARESPPLN